MEEGQVEKVRERGKKEEKEREIHSCQNVYEVRIQVIQRSYLQISYLGNQITV